MSMEFPLIDNFFSKGDCHALAEQLELKDLKCTILGIKIIIVLDIVKGGMGYWNRSDKIFQMCLLVELRQG